MKLLSTPSAAGDVLIGSTEHQCRVEWVSPIGKTGHGNWMSEHDARAWADQANRKFLDIKHRVVCK